MLIPGMLCSGLEGGEYQDHDFRAGNLLTPYALLQNMPWPSFRRFQRLAGGCEHHSDHGYFFR